VAVYFGSEFCEDGLPDLEEAEAIRATASDCGWEPALLTPLVTTVGLGRVDRLLAGLAANRRAPVVVFNDWGVFGLLRQRYPSLPKRAGRLMNRSLRDPRAAIGRHRFMSVPPSSAPWLCCPRWEIGRSTAVRHRAADTQV